MHIELLDHTKLSNIVEAGRVCYQSYHLGGNYQKPTDNITQKDTNYLERVVNQNGHASITRHVQYVFKVEGISTKTLLAATRHGPGTNFSVMSSRFCKIDKFGESFTETPNKQVNSLLVKHIQEIVVLHKECKPSAEDLAMLYPQAMQYNMIVSFNPQSLKHFFDMREPGTHAHFDIQELSSLLYDCIPKEHKFLFKSKLRDNITKL